MKLFVTSLLVATAAIAAADGQSYGAPSANRLGSSRGVNSAASQSYGAPGASNFGASRGGNGDASQSYGAPGRNSFNGGQKQNGGAQSYGSSGNRAGQQRNGYSAAQEQSYPPKPYDFQYEVRDNQGNDYGHQESSDGSRVEGQYRVLLPDSRMQTVTYYVEGDSGFVADVQYEGEAQFPDDNTGYGNRGGQASFGNGSNQGGQRTTGGYSQQAGASRAGGQSLGGNSFRRTSASASGFISGPSSFSSQSSSGRFQNQASNGFGSSSAPSSGYGAPSGSSGARAPSGGYSAPSGSSRSSSANYPSYP